MAAEDTRALPARMMKIGMTVVARCILPGQPVLFVSLQEG